MTSQPYEERVSFVLKSMTIRRGVKIVETNDPLTPRTKENIKIISNLTLDSIRLERSIFSITRLCLWLLLRWNWVN